MNDEEKTKLMCTGECPYCGEPIEVKKKTKVISPAVKAEKEERFVIEKGVQTKLS